MTVELDTALATSVFTGIGNYTFSFKVYTASTVKAEHVSALGATTNLVYLTDYTVTLNSESEGGYVTIINDVITGGTLRVRRELPVTQEVDLVNAGPLDVETLERAFDRLIMILQQMDLELEGVLGQTTWQGTWATTTVYSIKDIVQAPNENWYYCIEDHTADDFDTDLAAGAWVLMLDKAEIVALKDDAETAQAAAVAAQGLAEDARDLARAWANQEDDPVADLEYSAKYYSQLSENHADTSFGHSQTALGYSNSAQGYSLASSGFADDASDHSLVAQQWASRAENLVYEDGKYSALHYMEKSLNAKDAAETAQGLAEGAEDLAIEAQLAAEDARDLALGYRDNADDAADLAGKWAAEDEGTTVTTEGGAKYSALHYMEKALDAQGAAEAAYTDTLAIFGDATDVQAAVDATAADALATAADAASTAADVLTIEATTAALLAQNEFFRNELLKAMVPEQADTLLSSSTTKDVFIYDTTKDSDGGAWRLRCQNLSWYNEPLNTATRGGTREFPAVALIVCVSGVTDALYIYDATKAGCPLWMLFKNSNSSSPDYLGYLLSGASSTQYPIALSAKNGVLAVAFAAIRGSAIINFIKDSAGIGSSADSNFTSYPGLYGTWVHGIGRRNEYLGYNGVNPHGSDLFPSTTQYDIAMTVLDDAPIDPDTLLPVPTIAVATASGVAVIDGPAGAGTVVSVQSTTYPVVTKVTFEGYTDKFCALFGSSDSLQKFYSINEIPSADASAGSTLGGGMRFTTSSVPSVIDSDKDSISLKTMGGEAGLIKLEADLTTQTDSSVAYITHSYNTGWMKGDIRRAFICDTSGLIYDSHFQNPSAWVSAGTGAAVVSEGKAQFGGGAVIFYPDPQVFTTVGVDYSITFTISGVTAGSLSVVVANTTSVAYTADGTYTYDFTSGSPAIGLEFWGSATFDGALSEVFFTRTDELTSSNTVTDRSVKDTELTVTGTLTREPVATGAELQAISGFSTGNFLSQEFSEDLNFGTDDFFICCWVKPEGTTDEYFIARGAASGDGTFSLRTTSTSPPKYLFWTANSSGTPSSRQSVVDVSNTWTLVVAQRVSGDMQLFINGLLEADGVETVRDVDGTTSSLFIGGSKPYGASSSTTREIALVRIGAGSLTDDQIAEMYRTELPLFQPGAKCTLQGTSNVVKGLAYDERYNLLAATHGDKVTLFRDLEVEDVIDLDTDTGVAVDINNKGVLIGTSADAQWDNE